jgi:aryl-alcohol dehydrogenase-like predicted oxidoreductase
VREAEREVLPLCAEHGVRFQVFSPLAGGWLTGKYRRGEPFPVGSRMTLRPDERMPRDDVYDTIEELAARGDPATQAFAWLFANPRVDAVVVGPRTPEQLDPVFAALEEAASRS